MRTVAMVHIWKPFVYGFLKKWLEWWFKAFKVLNYVASFELTVAAWKNLWTGCGDSVSQCIRNCLNVLVGIKEPTLFSAKVCPSDYCRIVYFVVQYDALIDALILLWQHWRSSRRTTQWHPRLVAIRLINEYVGSRIVARIQFQWLHLWFSLYWFILFCNVFNEM